MDSGRSSADHHDQLTSQAGSPPSTIGTLPYGRRRAIGLWSNLGEADGAAPYHVPLTDWT